MFNIIVFKRNKWKWTKIDPMSLLDWELWKKLWKDFDKDINKVKVEEVENWFRVILNYDNQSYDYLAMILDHLKADELNLLNQNNNNLSIIKWETVLENIDDNKDYTKIKIHKIKEETNKEFREDIGIFDKWWRKYFWFAKKTTGWYLQIFIDLKTWQFVIWTNWTWKRIETTLFNITDKYLLYTSQTHIWEYEYTFKALDLSEWFNIKQEIELPIWYRFSHKQIGWYLNNRRWWNNYIWNNEEFLEINWIIYIVKVVRDNNDNSIKEIVIKDKVNRIEILWKSNIDKNSELFIYKSLTKNKIILVNKNLWIKKDISNLFDNINKYSITTIWDDYNLIDTQNKTLSILITNYRNNGKVEDFILINYETLEIFDKITNIPNNNDYTIKYNSYTLWIVKEENWNLVYAQKNNGKYFLNIVIDWQKVFGENWYDMSEVLNNPLRIYHFSYYDDYWFYKKFNVLIVEPYIDYKDNIFYIVKIWNEIRLLKDVKVLNKKEDRFIIRYENKDRLYSYIWIRKNWEKIEIIEKQFDLREYKDKIHLYREEDDKDCFYMTEWLAKIMKFEDLYN